jgi:hypothetical protein
MEMMGKIESSTTETMAKIEVKDFWLYLFGHEESIRKLARSDRVIYVAAFFVLIAGICREYDQEYIFARPEIFVFPFVASLVLCLLLRSMSQFYFRLNNNPQSLGDFRIFLSLFWLTAPGAWIYALPVELLFDSLTALKVNLWMLALVASWRVWLFTRVMKVVTGVNILPAIFAVGSPVILFASFSTVLNNMLTVMSGGSYSEEQKLLLSVNSFAAFVSMLATLPLLGLYFYHSTRQRTFTAFEEQERIPLSTHLKWSCFLLIIISVVMMINPQIQLGRLLKFKSIVAEKKYSEAVEYANQFELNEFPAVRKIYPPMKYYGFDDAIALLA